MWKVKSDLKCRLKNFRGKAMMDYNYKNQRDENNININPITGGIGVETLVAIGHWTRKFGLCSTH